MTIASIIKCLERIAPLSLQEDYDNAGLLLGDNGMACSGVLVSLDVTEEVIEEAIQKKCNLVVAHHPIIFRGLKKINGKNYIEKTIIKAIKNDVAIYAIHTNLDNVIDGVNAKMAEVLGLLNCKILVPKKGLLQKLIVYVPLEDKDKMMQALFDAGAGEIGQYSECSFAAEGVGTFKPGDSANPYNGEKGKRYSGEEYKLEVIFPKWLQSRVLSAMRSAHHYEEIAFDLIDLSNELQLVGSGLIGELANPISETDYLKLISNKFNVKGIRHTALLGKPIKKVALCGGSGSFLTGAAISAGADIYITSDIKYHEFFDADKRILLTDIGHFESEQYTIELLADVLRQNFPNFAVLKTGIRTNPVHTFLG